MSANRPVLATLVGIAALAFAGVAAAHAHLLGSDPVAGAKVGPIKTLTLHFSERLEPKFSGMELRKGATAVPVTVGSPADDHKALKGETTQPLTPGEYKLSWHAVSADGHRTQGAFTFTVR